VPQPYATRVGLMLECELEGITATAHQRPSYFCYAICPDEMAPRRAGYDAHNISIINLLLSIIMIESIRKRRAPQMPPSELCRSPWVIKSTHNWQTIAHGIFVRSLRSG
jgi:hypothetical protein